MANSLERQRVVRVHITQDDYGYWMTSLEYDDGSLTLASYCFEDRAHELQHAFHPEELGLPADTEFLISEPSLPLRVADHGWTKPQPRRVREPHFVIKNGKRVV